MAKWAGTTPQQEWLKSVREDPNPSPPYALPPYVFVKVGFGMNVKQLKYEMTVLYQRRGRNARFEEYFDLPFPPGTTEDEIVFVCPEPGMNTTRLAWKVVDVQIALEEQVDFPNNLTPEQRASLDGLDIGGTKTGLNTRIAAARGAKKKEETDKTEAGRETDPSQQRLDEVEARMRKVVELGRKVNMTFAPEFLERFLNRRGGIRRLSRAEFESLGPLAQAEAVNRHRFETMFLGDAEGSSTEPSGNAELLRKNVW
jgi:hypothetical protein